MANFRIKVEGLEDIQKTLTKLSDKADEANNLIYESALNVERKAKENLSATPFMVSVGGIAQSSYIERSNNGKEVEVGFNKHYSPYIEYGTGTKVDIPAGFEQFALQFIGKGIREVNIKPHPYFHPALQSEIINLKKALSDLLK